MLVLLDETVQQVRIAAAETASNCAGFGLHRIHEAISYGVHATRTYGRGGKKDAGGKTFSYSALSDSYSVRYPIAAYEHWWVVRGWLLRPRRASDEGRQYYLWVVSFLPAIRPQSVRPRCLSPLCLSGPCPLHALKSYGFYKSLIPRVPWFAILPSMLAVRAENPKRSM